MTTPITVEATLRNKLTAEAEAGVAALLKLFEDRLRELGGPGPSVNLEAVKIILQCAGTNTISIDAALQHIKGALISEIVDRRFPGAVDEIVNGKTQAVHVESRAEVRRTPRRAMLLYKLNEAGLLNGMRVIAIEDIRADEEIQMVPELFIDRSPI